MMDFYAEKQFKLMPTGEEAFKAMLSAIDNAHIQYKA
jgi:hypothetical protein